MVCFCLISVGHGLAKTKLGIPTHTTEDCCVGCPLELSPGGIETTSDTYFLQYCMVQQHMSNGSVHCWSSSKF